MHANIKDFFCHGTSVRKRSEFEQGEMIYQLVIILKIPEQFWIPDKEDSGFLMAGAEVINGGWKKLLKSTKDVEHERKHSSITSERPTLSHCAVHW